MATTAQLLERARDNYCRILILVTQIVADTNGNALAEPTRAQIDTVVEAADTAGVMRPRVTNTVGNRSVDWTGYQTFLVQQIDALEKMIQERSWTGEVRTRGYV